MIYLDPNDNISDLLLSSKLFSFAAPIPMADEDPDLLMALQLSLQESGTQQHYESPDIMEN